MPDCLITNGILAECADLRRVGGVNKRLWMFNINDLDKTTGTNGYTIDVNGFITAIAWGVYGCLYKFESQQQSHSGGWTEQIQAGGNRFFQHDVIAKLFNTTPADDQVIEELLVADVGIIIETNNQEFILYGGFNGMRSSEGVQNSGQEAGSDTTAVLTFMGQEKELPKRVYITSYAATLTLLQGYEC